MSGAEVGAEGERGGGVGRVAAILHGDYDMNMIDIRTYHHRWSDFPWS